MSHKKTVIIFLVSLFSIIIIISSAQSKDRKDNILTYSSFRYVRYVASSINKVYFATSRGIIVFNKLKNRWENPLTDTEGIDHTEIYRIWVDKFDQKLYAETKAFLYEYDFFLDKWFTITEMQEQELYYNHIKPKALMHPPDGYIYSGDGSISDSYGRKFILNDIIDDNSGYFWIGSWGLGPLKASSASNYIEMLPFGLIQNNVNIIYNDYGTLWIGGYQPSSNIGGITIFDPESSSFEYFKYNEDNFFPYVDINDFVRYKNYMAMASSQGVLFFDEESRSVSHQIDRNNGLFDENVLCLETIGDSLFIGTYQGLNLLTKSDRETQLIYPDIFLNATIHDLQVVDSTLWIASTVGVYRLLLKSGKLQQFQDNDNIIFNHAYSLKLFDNYLFFSTDNGILKLNLKTAETRTFHLSSYNQFRRPLAVNDKIAITADNQGVVLIFHNEESETISKLTINDGLPSNYINYLEMDGDYVWIGSDAGLSRLWWSDPDRIY